MNMNQQFVLIAFLLIHANIIKCDLKCNLYPFDPLACIQQTQQSSCFYSYFENKCIENILTNEGCQANLNIKACQNQLTDYYNQKVKCIFDTRCREVNQYHLSSLGCDQYYSKFACLEVQGYDCVWDNQCIEKKDLQFNHDSCETIYSLPVTPSLCAIIPEFPCFHGGEENDYQCISMTELMINSIDCNQPGLNEYGCLMIEKEGQLCQYINNKCQQIDPQKNDSCGYKFNRIACLSITNPIIKCQWRFGSCKIFTNEENNQCSNLKEVNVNVCLNLDENCKFDKQKFACIEVEKHEIQQQTCNTYGLTKMACLQIKNMYCTFYNGYCEEINETHLLFYKCQMDINEDACLNIKSKSQLCKWNGKQCSNIFITQNDSCQSISQNIKVNGLVCQSIIKTGEKCKYNQTTHQCIESQKEDLCETPYININGCINITAFKQSCQWTIDGCKLVQILNYQTKCESLKFANYYACSQILESESLGCYFNKISNQCEKLYVDQPTEKGLNLQQEYLKAQQFLKVIGCNDPSLGLNKIICGSILTEGQACRWLKDSCVQVKKKKYLSTITCIELQYSNSQTCAMVHFGKEPCRYHKQVKGCINSIVKEMKCDEIGLNSYGCTFANGGCYYDYQINKCQGVEIDLKNPLSLFSDILLRLECITHSPTQEICLAILTKGQLCSWSFNANACIEMEVLENKKCLDFSGPLIQVNANVCASIVMSFPDYDEIAYKKDSSKLVDENRGYCAYDPNTANCIIRTTPCNSNCCTDNADIGINQHVCSRFSIQTDNIYCYFDNLSCKELTPLTVDTSNPISVAQFYNAKQFKCTQMNKISCHMIDWSSKQRCYYNGLVCLSVDTQDFINLDIFTVPPAIVNKYLCYSIEGVITDKNKLKYFKYNSDKKLCDIPDLQSFTKYNNCEQVDGNMNYCLRYTENLNCRWDRANLKCITIDENEILEIKTCTYDQNIKVCKENKNAACQFSYNLDKCINSPKNVNCNSFSQTGPVSIKACQAITQFGQMCEFSNYTCINTIKSSDSCDVQGTNSNACYNNTKGNCRWHSDKMICYENVTPIEELRCSDNLNKVLCSKVQKEPCVWDQNLLLCIYSLGMPYSKYLNLNPNDISEWACTLITGGAVHYDKINKSCQTLDSSKKNYNCTDLQMNNYACLLFTQGNNCYFDQSEIMPNNKCKPFLTDQSACTTQIKINIEVCMNIPKSCYFSALTLECLNVEIGSSLKCSQLKNDLVNQNLYNKMACSSIDFLIEGTDNQKQCIKTVVQEQAMFQQECNFEKNCFWDEKIYTCNIMTFQRFWFDYHYFESFYLSFNQYNRTCDGRQESESCGSYVVQQETKKENYILPGSSWHLYCRKKKCNLTDVDCSSDLDCEKVSILNYNIEYNGTVIQRQYQTQKCISFCQKGFDFELCDPANPLINKVDEVLQYSKLTNQICQNICESPVYQNCVPPRDPSMFLPGALICQQSIQQPCEKQCAVTKDQCQDICNVQLVVKSWVLKQAECKVQKFYYKKPQCRGFYYVLNKCLNIYSKAICLTMVREPCIFNLQFGGCLPLKGNEDKIPDCYSITDNYVQINNNECNGYDNFCEFNKSQQSTLIRYNNCFSSATKNKFCTLLNEPFNAVGDTCKNIDRTYFHCVPLTTNYNSPYTCDSISINDAQPALCAGAIDSCWLSSGKCDSKIPVNCECDFSYSKTLCEKCKCNFSFQGRCLKSYMAPQLKPDKSNYYYLCDEVNNLPTTKDNKKLACGMVEQACKYGVICEDATNYSCDQLKSAVVTKKACISCDGKSTLYDTEKYSCLQLVYKTVQQCDNLNKLACLTKTTNVKCIWRDFQCQEINSLDDDSANNCSIFNLETCKISNCWYDDEKQQCLIFNPYKGSCNQLLKKEHCLKTLTQSCVWNNQECQVNSSTPTQCENLNRFGCVTQTILNCVWLNTLNKCQYFELSPATTSCSSPLSTDYSLNSLITNHSPNICTQINLEQSCFLDTQKFQCRQIIVLDTITCDSKGLNKYACITRTQGRCQFVNKQCLKTNDNNQGCQNYLNQEACLFQKETCQFQNNQCSPYFVSYSQDSDILNNLINSTVEFPYSYSVCKQFDSTTALSLVFSSEKNRCINVSSRLPYISSCILPGLNLNACLTKTTLPCIYKEDGCTNFDKILLKTATTCLGSLKLNWVACTQLSAKCKFKNNMCTPLLDDEIDTCTQLEKQNYIVNSKVCQSRKDVACSFNSITSTCAQVKTNVLCSATGLNKIGCINQTRGSICQFYKEECIFNYENTLCTDFINQDKCYQIKTKNQYCKFESNECISQNINDVSKCVTGIQTNAFTCSLSTDERCFYNIKTGFCIKYENPPDIKILVSINYNWANSISFNILTCQSYNLDNKKIRWNEGCVEVQDTELAYLKCNQYLNQSSCVQIITPFQYCQYINGKCVEADLENFKTQYCESIKLINNGAFCEVNQVQSCKYDRTIYSCVLVLENNINCSEFEGYNQLACSKDTEQCSFSGSCLKNYEKNISSCDQVPSENLDVCKQILIEGCTIENNQCRKLIEQEYSEYVCEQAVNSKGCLQIRTIGQTCQYFSNSCVFKDLEVIKHQNCNSITFVNSYICCEVTQDIACKFNQKKNSCEELSPQEEFPCIRGLNKLACLNQTSKFLRCNFLNYCYGPNNAFSNCSEDPNKECCDEATTVESCLFQKQQKCYWSNGCFSQQQLEQQCDQIKNASILVCTEIQSQICIFNPLTFACQIIIPQSCDQLQTIKQCNEITNFPCIWNYTYQACQHKVQNNYDSCQDILEQNGNEKACTMVQSAGQSCIFLNSQCLTYSPSENQDNCLSNINKISCLQQQFSNCQWNYYYQEIKQTSSSDVEIILIGKCEKFLSFLSSSCNDSLSFLSCINIIKPGEQCRWKNNHCEVIEFENQEIISINLFEQVNSLACALVNDGTLVQYDPKTYACKQIFNAEQINCVSILQGLNQQACFNIKQQLCRWNDILKICQPQKDTNTLVGKTCQLEGVIPNFCSQINLQLPCAYKGNGCDQIDLTEIDCLYPGLNQYSCLNIKQYPCIWIQENDEKFYSCQFYHPHTECLNIIHQVSFKVCQMVEADACYYDEMTNKCQTIQSNNQEINCNQSGLNAKGCVLITGCIYFDGKCKLFDTKKQYFCEDVPLANEKICKNAQDACKFSIIDQGCVKSNLNDQCNTKGLSKLGCQQIDKCIFNNNQCQCKAALDFYTECTDIYQSIKCESVSFCYFEVYEKKDQTYIECKKKQCSQISNNQCNNFQIKNDICYLDQNNLCKKASTCNEIVNPLNDCSLFQFNQMQCWNSKSSNTCSNFTCLALSAKECLEKQNSKYCQLKSQMCIELDCEIITDKIICEQYNCDWQSKQKCHQRIPCSKYETEKECNNKISQNLQCTWIDSSLINVCSHQGCRYLSIQTDCTGTQIGINNCVELEDNTCVACEEIEDPCHCYLFPKYCKYENQKCKSKLCNDFYSEQECRNNDCSATNILVNSISQFSGCYKPCKKIYFKRDCNNEVHCLWDNKSCQEKSDSVVVPDQVHGKSENVIPSILLIFFIGN